MFSSGSPLTAARDRPSLGFGAERPSLGLTQPITLRPDDDNLSSVSATAPRDALASSLNSVTNLRDRLLKEARNERARCLEVAEAAERRRSLLHGLRDATTQTDPVVISESGNASSSTLTALVGTQNVAKVAWSAEDEAAQNEAIRTIQLLKESGGQNRRATEGRMQDLEAEIRAEQAGRQECETQAAHERSRKEAAQQQVLCLEYELDGKEAALSVAERALERRDADLQQAQLHIRALQDGGMALPTSGGVSNDDPRLRALRTQLLERERQLELKDQHISRLLNVLRQHREIFTEEDGLSPTRCYAEGMPLAG